MVGDSSYAMLVEISKCYVLMDLRLSKPNIYLIYAFSVKPLGNGSKFIILFTILVSLQICVQAYPMIIMIYPVSSNNRANCKDFIRYLDMMIY